MTLLEAVQDTSKNDELIHMSNNNPFRLAVLYKDINIIEQICRLTQDREQIIEMSAVSNNVVTFDTAVKIGKQLRSLADQEYDAPRLNIMRSFAKNFYNVMLVCKNPLQAMNNNQCFPQDLGLAILILTSSTCIATQDAKTVINILYLGNNLAPCTLEGESNIIEKLLCKRIIFYNKLLTYNNEKSSVSLNL
jgi:hypothetical protein